TRWEEDWRLTASGLEIVEARIKGSGAGMEAPDRSVLKDGWWAYQPSLPPLPALVLAASGATGTGWRICIAEACQELGSASGEPIKISRCGSPPSAAESTGADAGEASPRL